MADKRRLLTIGVYGFSEAEFFHRLQDARVDLFVDIRARRGMRGSEYAFVNSTRLQSRLTELGIAYLHLRSLAPSQEIRDIQKQVDAEANQPKRKRAELGEIFVSAYQRTILSSFDTEAFFASLDPTYQTLCLFCVEHDPLACHRSLAAPYLANYLEAGIQHLT